MWVSSERYIIVSLLYLQNTDFVFSYMGGQQAAVELYLKYALEPGTFQFNSTNNPQTFQVYTLFHS